jgi:hypothetical protein
MKGFAIRIAVVGVLALLAALKASIGDGLTAEEWVDVIGAPIIAGAAYAGIGAASKTVEPDIGIKTGGQ